MSPSEKKEWENQRFADSGITENVFLNSDSEIAAAAQKDLATWISAQSAGAVIDYSRTGVTFSDAEIIANDLASRGVPDWDAPKYKNLSKDEIVLKFIEEQGYLDDERMSDVNMQNEVLKLLPASIVRQSGASILDYSEKGYDDNFVESKVNSYLSELGVAPRTGAADIGRELLNKAANDDLRSTDPAAWAAMQSRLVTRVNLWASGSANHKQDPYAAVNETMEVEAVLSGYGNRLIQAPQEQMANGAITPVGWGGQLNMSRTDDLRAVTRLARMDAAAMMHTRNGMSSKTGWKRI